MHKTVTIGKIFVGNNNTLSFAATETGRITPQADGRFRNEYFLTDHLGNTRTLFTDENNDGTPELLQETHYDPYGMALGNLSYETADGNNKYKYNGKELQDDLGLNWYDYGARMYDAAIGRWHVVDPMANKRNWVSSYSYCQNNPMNRIDPDGAYDTDFGVTDEGKISQIGPTNNEPDRLFALNNNGTKKDVAPIIIEKGSITASESGSYITEKDNKPITVTYHAALIKGDDQAQEIAKFLWDNTSKEWGITKAGNVEGKEGLNIIST